MWDSEEFSVSATLLPIDSVGHLFVIFSIAVSSELVIQGLQKGAKPPYHSSDRTQIEVEVCCTLSIYEFQFSYEGNPVIAGSCEL